MGTLRQCCDATSSYASAHRPACGGIAGRAAPKPCFWRRLRGAATHTRSAVGDTERVVCSCGATPAWPSRGVDPLATI